MMAPTTNGWHVDPRRERLPENLRNYLRSEFREKDADWLLQLSQIKR